MLVALGIIAIAKAHKAEVSNIQSCTFENNTDYFTPNADLTSVRPVESCRISLQ
jgi:hypothetical protein